MNWSARLLGARGSPCNVKVWTVSAINLKYLLKLSLSSCDNYEH